MEISRSDFGHNFIFGSGTAAYQVEGATKEGGRGPSIWDTATKRQPDIVANWENGDVAVDSYHLYKEDVKFMKQIGLDYYRFSISWTRVLPGGKLNAGVNNEGIQYYNNLIDELLKNDIQPFVTLFHFEVPQALEDEYGGFLSENIVDDFCDFARVCFWEFGDRVKYWTTLNEPWTFSNYGYAAGRFPPCRGSSSEDHASHPIVQHRCGSSNPRICEHGDPGREPYTVTRNLLLAHAEAVRIYRENYKEAQGGKIGIVLVTHWFEPLHQSSVNDKEAASRALDFKFGWFMEPITYGRYPKRMTENVPSDRLKPFSADESAKLKNSYDFLGLNYYTAAYAYNDTTCYEHHSYLTDSHAKTRPKAADGLTNIGEQTSCGWIYIYPKGIHKLLCHIKTYYNDPPIFITENGVTDAGHPEGKISQALADEIRIRYHRDHLQEVKRAINEERVDVKGYFIWSLLDNFEWTAGYKDRFGLVYVDYNDARLRRYPKDSAIWFKNFLKKKKARHIDHEESNDLIVKPTLSLSKSDLPAVAKELLGFETPAKRTRER